LAAALLEANATARPHGESGPAPEELWQHRPPITREERMLFQAEVQRQRQEIADQGGPEMNPKKDLHARARERQTIRRALEGLGYLTYTRRRIPLPIRKQKAAIIT